MTPIDGVRALAACHGYEEVQFNETSRVIAFAKSDPNKTRVNVYYTTGTVATCLHHPYSGKTQLFRREQTLESLGELFANPRQHTGSGYYKCGGPPLKWTRCFPSANQYRGNRNDQEKAECDDSRHWLYVQAATNFCTPQQASQIAAFCKLFNELRFAPGITKREYFNSLSKEVQDQVHFCPHNCGDCGKEREGSWCSLGAILVAVALETDPGRIFPILLPDFEKKKLGEGEERPDPIPLACFIQCEYECGKEFKDTHESDLIRLNRQLLSFPKPVRRELLYFFMKKIAHSWEMFIIARPDEEEGVWILPIADEEVRMSQQTYGGYFKLSDAVYVAHGEYGEMMYGDDEVGKLCSCHGYCG
jgi:hypothetical protein